MHNSVTTNVIQLYFKCTYYQLYFHHNEVEVLCNRKCCSFGLNCLSTLFKQELSSYAFTYQAMCFDSY